MDKQQGCIVEHRELYSLSCDKPWWKRIWKTHIYIRKIESICIQQKLTQYCKSTMFQFKKERKWILSIIKFSVNIKNAPNLVIS